MMLLKNRNNKITRDEGVNLVKKFDHEFPTNYFKEFLEYINISRNCSIKLWINLDQIIYGNFKIIIGN